ncbi:hypothetical protein FGB62_14g237 [Gracilaria domingensis]|nr:hypothetical protein FGB62_14g237 [Gracilaria domingensis]
MCDIVKNFPDINHALELYFLLYSDTKLWGCGKATRLPIQVSTKDYLRDTRNIRSFSIRITEGDNHVLTLAEPKRSTPDAVMFCASYVDLQNLLHRSMQCSGSKPVEIFIDTGRILDLRIGGTILSRRETLEVILARLRKAYDHFQEKRDELSREEMIIVITDGNRKSRFYINPPLVAELPSIPKSLPIRPRLSDWLRCFDMGYSKRVKTLSLLLCGGVTSDELAIELECPHEENKRADCPPACALTHDKIKLLWTKMEDRKHERSCSTMVRCLCAHHIKDPFTVQDFFIGIVEAIGDVAMTRGSCPMCSIRISQRSEKPLVRFTEEVFGAGATDYDWSDFEFRGMLFEMFPDNWIDVENEVYTNKTISLSCKAEDACRTVLEEMALCLADSLSTEQVFNSDVLRPWPLYEMAISKSHKRKALAIAREYLDVALGHLFCNQLTARFNEENPIVTRILVSAAQMIPGGRCSLDDTARVPPHSRSESHIVGCFVVYKSPRMRALAEMLRTWDSIPWDGDITSYLKSAYQRKEEFTHGALPNYYHNSINSIAIKVVKCNGIPHVTSLLNRAGHRKNVNEGCEEGWDGKLNTINKSQPIRRE